MKAMVMDHDGKSLALSRALAAAGWQLVNEAREADVILIDHDVPTHGKLAHAEACVEAGGRAFIYPHGGGAGTIAGWDGMYPVSPIISGLFANGPGHGEIARRYGYPHPVHDFGWTMCDLRPRRATGRVQKVVFAAQHPKGNGHLSDWKLARNQDIFRRLLATGCELAVRHIDTLEANGLWHVDGVEYTDARLSDLSGQLAQIDSADVVVSDRATFSCLAIARGVTTVMFDSTVIARDLDRTQLTDHIELYRDYIRFPFDAGDEGSDILELMQAAAQDEDLVGEWRERFVGGPFKADVLVEVLEGDRAHLQPHVRARRLHAAAIHAAGRHAGDHAERLASEAAAAIEPDLLNDLAVLRWNLGLKGEAEALLRACLAIHPANEAAAANLAAITTARAA